MSAWVSEIVARFRSGRFTPFLSGIDVELLEGKRVTLKVIKTVRSIRPPGLRFAKYSFVTEVAAGKHTGFGFGESESKLVALQKSIAEGVERAIFLNFTDGQGTKANSNGWAAHVSSRHAYAAALDELLERDAILVHWLSKSPFIEVMPETWPSWIGSWAASELSRAKRFRRLRILRSHLGHIPTVTTLLMDRDGFGVASHSAGSSLDVAFYRALAETCRIAHVVLSSNTESSVSMDQPEGRAFYYAERSPLPDWIFGRQTAWDASLIAWNCQRSEFKQAEINPAFHQVATSPLIIGYATSPMVQGLYFGSESDQRANLNINSKSLQKVRTGYLNPMPHFIS